MIDNLVLTELMNNWGSHHFSIPLPSPKWGIYRDGLLGAAPKKIVATSASIEITQEHVTHVWNSVLLQFPIIFVLMIENFNHNSVEFTYFRCFPIAEIGCQAAYYPSMSLHFLASSSLPQTISPTFFLPRLHSAITKAFWKNQISLKCSPFFVKHFKQHSHGIHMLSLWDNVHPYYVDIIQPRSTKDCTIF